MADKWEAVIQWNVQGLIASKQDLTKLVDELKPGIVAVQESWRRNSYLRILGKYYSISKDCSFNRTYPGGVAIYIHNSFLQKELFINTPLQVGIARVQVCHYKPVTFTSMLPVYECSSEIFEPQILDIIDQMPNSTVLLGDLNAQYQQSTWSARKSSRGHSDQPGVKLYKYLLSDSYIRNVDWYYDNVSMLA